jgi:hypothetical protein
MAAEQPSIEATEGEPASLMKDARTMRRPGVDEGQCCCQAHVLL